MSASVQPGTVIDGKYRVLRHIGEGGMGTVYEGENIRIERRVAIKVLHEHVAQSADFAERFEREARASARIGSPHVCDVLDLGDLPNGERYIVMEFLDGESLEDRIERVGKMSAHHLAPIAFEILDGLGTMHQAGVIHRDLKPANVFLARRGNARVESVKILDFGVAKILPRADEPNQMTATGMMMGTPLYMSPEQARGARDVDGRTDLYAASVIFYRALTGQMPHSALNLHELLFKIVLEEPPPITELAPEVDPAFAAIVTKGLARDPDHRFPTARAYQEAIAEWGQAQGRTSLQFAITLPSDPPPIKSISGGYPMSNIKAPITGPVRPETGPPTPALATTAGSPKPNLTPGGGPKDGTPIVWSEDAPEAAKRAYRELEARKAAASHSKTQPLDKGGFSDSQRVSGELSPPAPSKPPPRQAPMKIALAFGAVAVIGAAVIGIKLASGHGLAGSPPTASTTSPVVAESAPPPATQLSDPTPPPHAVDSPPANEPTEPTEPTPTTPTTPRLATAPAMPHGTIAPKSSATPSATVALSATVAAPAPTPTPTSSTRKFRTKID